MIATGPAACGRRNGVTEDLFHDELDAHRLTLRDFDHGFGKPPLRREDLNQVFARRWAPERGSTNLEAGMNPGGRSCRLFDFEHIDGKRAVSVTRFRATLCQPKTTVAARRRYVAPMFRSSRR